MNTKRSSVLAAQNIGCKTAAEIGVYQGYNALMMIELLGLEHIYLIDPFTPFDEPSSKMGKEPVFPKNENIAREVLSRYADRCTWIIKRSDEADIPPVDFVYIDGSHEYPNVCADIDKYYPLATKIIGGHDYLSKPGVKRAVDEYVKRNGLKLYTAKSDWYIIK